MDHKLVDVPRRGRSVHEVTRLEFCRDIRDDVGHARREFEEVVQRVGRMYEGQSRGWSSDAPALVHDHDEADKERLVVMGSMRLHHARRIVTGSPLDEWMIVIESGEAAAR